MTTVALGGAPTQPAAPRTQESTGLAAVRAHADRSPAGAALLSEQGEIGYAELWDRAQRHAATLLAGAGERLGPVVVPASHDCDTVVALLGSWLAGGTY